MKHSRTQKRHHSESIARLSEASSTDEDRSLFSEPPAKKPYKHNYSDKSNGRRGFGLKLNDLDAAASKWCPKSENIQLCETVHWIESDNLDDVLSSDELKSWIVEGDRKWTIDDETRFCDPQVLADVIAQKSIFGSVSASDLRAAHIRSNPFETTDSSIFLNSAAVKMANIDAILNFMFTNPVDEYGASLVHENDLLHFADVCAGPGDFSEYVLWKNKWLAKGFGFKLHDFLVGHPKTFDTFSGCNGDEKVYNPANVASLTDYVFKRTLSGVHFMVSDSGSSVDGHEDEQELWSKPLHLGQCLMALSIVRTGGHFVMKLFDMFTPFSVGLVYLMYKCFKRISIIKPNSSRPGNSERYLVCKWKKPFTYKIRNYLYEANEMLFNNYCSSVDILELVPFEVLRNDEKFFRYIFDSNNTIGRNQTVALMKIAAFCKDHTLMELRQSECRQKCLKLWGLPNQMRTVPPKISTKTLFKTLLGKWYDQREFLSVPDERLTSDDRRLEDLLGDKKDWWFVPLHVVENTGKTIRTFFMSNDNRTVYKYNDNKTWSAVTEVIVEMPPNTLVYGEIVSEVDGEGDAQRRIYALHIIDGIILGGIDIRRMPIRNRNLMCWKFAKALNEPRKTISGATGQSIAPIRCKPLIDITDWYRLLDAMDPHQMKDGKTQMGLPACDDMNPERFYVPHGILLFRSIKSSLQKKRDTMNWKHPELIHGSFKDTFCFRRLWKWEHPRQLSFELNELDRERDLLYRVDFERVVYDIGVDLLND